MKIEELFSVRGKVALVTGGSRGLGEMFARAYVENGVKVYISSRKAEACASLAEELSKYGTCIPLPADLSKMDEIERLATKGGEIGKRLDFLIQELHREANTMGSKSAALELTRISVDMKVLIEQMREQVQNLE